jgi:hypothetical protein
VTIRDIAFDDFGVTLRGVAVGDAGAVYTTSDGGVTWMSRSTGVTADWRSVALRTGLCGTADCVWVVGTGGSIAFSSDSGVTWCAQSSGTTATLNAVNVDFNVNVVNPNVVAGPNVTAVGANATVVRSTTARTCGAGAAYSRIAVPASVAPTTTLNDIDGFGEGFIAGGGGTILIVGPDGTISHAVSGTTADLYGIARTTTEVGTAEALACGCRGHIRVVAVGSSGAIVEGVTARPFTGNAVPPVFRPRPSGTTQTLRDIALVPEAYSFLGGTAVGDNGTVLAYFSGTEWARRFAGTCADLHSVWMTAIYQPGRPSNVAAGQRGTVVDEVGYATAPRESECSGYRMVASDGGVFSFGDRIFRGSTGGARLNAPIIGGATDRSDLDGYWLLAADGGVFAFDAAFYGSLSARKLASPPVEIESTPTGRGYWIVLANGTVFAFGDATHVGDLANAPPKQSIVAMSSTPTGRGYWMTSSDGAVNAFGDAPQDRSLGTLTLNAPIIDMAPTADGQGYYLLGRDGGVFAFGSATFHGSTGGTRLNAPVVAMLVPKSGGYLLAAADGGVFAFGTADFFGSTGALKLTSPVLDFVA